MTFDFTINAPTMMAGFSSIIVVVIWLVRLEGKADTTAKDNGTLSKTLATLEGLVALHHQQFLDYRLEAAEKYVTREAVNEIKRDLGDEMKDMERRLEQAIDRAIKTVRGD